MVYREAAAKQKGGIYIHIPFCVQKCSYCDFYSTTDLSLTHDFLNALHTEIRIRRAASQEFDTLYIGGGTPSVMPPEQIEALLEKVYKNFKLVQHSEITIEVNPGTINLSVLKQYRKTGINRISIGIQSFSEENLRFLGRIHSASDAIKTIQEARNADFSNISLDLIYGLPGQTSKAWEADLARALEFTPEHLSCYMLTYEPRTPLTAALNKKHFSPLGEKKTGELFMATSAFLAENRYRQYEISNYSLKGIFPSMHNRKYWSFHPYTGLGPSAHSFSGSIRSWNHRSVTRYIEDLKKDQLPVENKEILNREQKMIEAIYLGLRQTDGIDLENFHANFHQRFEKIFENVIAILKDKKYLEMDQGRCFLSLQGMLFLDSIAGMFAGTDF
ncbi:MAG: radical SAM family heme chaperone HemW [Desulfobacterales bacterium]